MLLNIIEHDFSSRSHNISDFIGDFMFLADNFLSECAYINVM